MSEVVSVQLTSRVRNAVMARLRQGRWCVYTHSIGGEVFYVGCGIPKRPFAKTRRTELWKSIAYPAGGFDIEILGWFEDRKEAIALERETIQSLRPRANQLLNGYRKSEEFRAMMSLVHGGKVNSEETKRKVSSGLKGFFSSMDKEQKRLHFMLVNGAKMKPLVDKETGIVYDSLREASRETKMKRETIKAHTEPFGRRRFRAGDR